MYITKYEAYALAKRLFEGCVNSRSMNPFNFIRFAGRKANLTKALLSRKGSGECNAMRLTARGICGREVGVVVGHRYRPTLGVHGLG